MESNVPDDAGAIPRHLRIIAQEQRVTVTNHDWAAQKAGPLDGGGDIPLPEVILRIISLATGLSDFWGGAHGWAPVEAANLLSKSRLDWQVSLSHSLWEWLRELPDGWSKGCLILAWANLGALVEGAMKLFLSVWYSGYCADPDAIRRKDKLVDPDGLSLESLRQFFRKSEIWDESYDEFVQYVQHRRNAVHAFKDREIGTWEDFYSALRKYLVLLRYINYRLPYPGDEYSPTEYAWRSIQSDNEIVF